MRTERLDYWEHFAGVTDFPTGKGGRTTSAGAALTRLGTRVVLYSAIPNVVAASAISILKGDGVTNYFTTWTWPGAGNMNGAQAPIGPFTLNDGLAISSGATGVWLITFYLIQ